MLCRALWDRRHPGATRIRQCTRRYAPRTIIDPHSPFVLPMSQCMVHHAEIPNYSQILTHENTVDVFWCELATFKRILFWSSPPEHTQESLNTYLDISNIGQIRDYFITLIMYKLSHGMRPSILEKCLYRRSILIPQHKLICCIFNLLLLKEAQNTMELNYGILFLTFYG